MENSDLPEDKRDMVLKKIYERLSDKSVKKELHAAIKRIEEIYGYPIDIALIIDDVNDPLGLDTYNQDSYNYSMDMNYDEMLKKPSEKTMKLSEFFKFLNEEDHALKLCIDPIYLKKGMNEIGNVLLTTYDNKVIIVPKPVDENEKDSNRN